MIHKALRLACGNEHGFGDVFFPDDGSEYDHPTSLFDPRLSNARIIRREAKKAGWGRIMNEDYCPDCMAIEKECDDA